MEPIEQQLTNERLLRYEAERRLKQVSQRTAELEELLAQQPEEYFAARRPTFAAMPDDQTREKDIGNRYGVSSISSNAIQQSTLFASRMIFLENCFLGDRSKIDSMLSVKNVKQPSYVPDSEWNYAIVFNNPDYGEDPPTEVDLETAESQFDSCFKGEFDSYGFVQSLNKRCEKEAFKNSFCKLPEFHRLRPDFAEMVENQKHFNKGKHLVLEGNKWVMNHETATDYCTLIRNIVQTKLSLHVGLKTKLLLSKDGRYIYMLVSADEQDLANEAQRTNYNLQLEIAASDVASLEPCDEKMRLLRLLKKPKDIGKRLKEIASIFRNAAFDREDEEELEEELHEPTGVTQEVWDNYREFIDIVKHGVESIKTQDVPDDRKYSYFKAVIQYAYDQVNARRPAARLYTLWERLGIKGQLGAYSNFVKRIDRYKKVDTVAHYWRTYPVSQTGDRSIFRIVDRLKLTYTMILSQIDLHKLDTLDLIVTHFPLNNETELNGFNLEIPQLQPQSAELPMSQIVRNAEYKPGVLKTWSTKDYLEGPISDIRNYYGEKVALYFWFLYTYTKWLGALGLLGLIVTIVGYHEIESTHRNYLHTVFCICTVIWSTAFMESWKRHQTVKAIEWGQVDFEEDETTRPQFQGEAQRSPVTDSNNSLHYDKSARLKYIFLGIGISFGIIVLAGVLVYLILYWRLIAIEKGYFLYNEYDFSSDLFGLLTAVQIEVFNFLYYKVSVRLTDLENYKTQSQYENSLIIKTYLFEFFNSYNSIIYIAFFKQQVEGCLSYVDQSAGANYEVDCMYELRTQLTWIFIIHVAMNLFATVKPLVVEWWKSRTKRTEQETEKSLQSNLDREMKKEEFLVRGLDGTFSEYLELMVQFGYNTLFAVAFPLAPFLAFCSNLVEIGVDRFKILYLFRRPTPLGAKTIGQWSNVLDSLTMISILTNSALLCFTLRAFDDWPLFGQDPFIPFILLVAGMLASRKIVRFLIDDIPENYASVMKRHDRAVDNLIKGFEPNKKTYEESKEWLVLKISET